MNTIWHQLIVVAILLVTNSALAEPVVTDNKVLDYFNQIVYGSEFNNSTAVITKWETDIRYYISGNLPLYLKEELNAIVGELNSYIRPLTMKQVTRKNDANLILVFGHSRDYLKVEPAARKHLNKNFGLFWVYWNKNKMITNGSVFVDTTRANTPRWQKHLLREELTQALGLMRDSFSYPESIFYQKYSTVNSYATIDKAIIMLLYHPFIKPGMSRKTANTVLKKLLQK